MLSHFSVKEYLTSQYIDGGRASTFHISEGDAHAFLSKGCAAYLLQYQNMDLGLEDIVEVANRGALSHYCCTNWSLHARYVNPADTESTRLFSRLLSLENQAYKLLVRTHVGVRYRDDLRHGGHEHTHLRDYTLAWASRSGLTSVVRILLERDKSTINDVICHETILATAAWSGNLKLTEILLQAGADPIGGHPDRTPFLYCPILCAMYSRDTDVIKLLLDTDKIWYLDQAIHFALKREMSPMAYFALSTKQGRIAAQKFEPVSPTVEGKTQGPQHYYYYSTMIHRALERCYSQDEYLAKIIGKLLQYGGPTHEVNANHSESHTPTPLLYAAKLLLHENTVKVIRTLVCHGADVNFQTSLGDTALHLLARQRQVSRKNIHLWREGASSCK